MLLFGAALFECGSMEVTSAPRPILSAAAAAAFIMQALVINTASADISRAIMVSSHKAPGQRRLKFGTETTDKYPDRPGWSSETYHSQRPVLLCITVS